MTSENIKKESQVFQKENIPMPYLAKSGYYTTFGRPIIFLLKQLFTVNNYTIFKTKDYSL